MEKNKIIKSRSGREYFLEEIEGISSLGDYKRKLFRVTNKKSGKISYKGIRVSGTNIAVESAKGRTLDDIYKELFKSIATEILNDDENNIEYFMGENQTWLKLNDLGEPLWQK